MRTNIKLFFIITIFISLALSPIGALAQSARSNCVVTHIGPTPVVSPVLPPECAASGSGDLLLPPGLIENLDHPGYFQMPPATDGSYVLLSCANRRWGSKDLISVLYTVARRWKTEFPKGRLNIGDLNAIGHKSHNWGRANDLDATTDGRDWVSDYTKGSYNRDATIKLGKMLADTDMVLNIWYNDVAVDSAVLAYSNEIPGHSKGMVMKPQPGHDNHFHLDVRQTPAKLPFWTPGC